MISYDNALMRFGMPIIEAMAEEQGINLEPLWYPPETTDFAPVAAQARERDPDAIGLVVSSAVPLINALVDEGISAQELPIFTSVALVPPEVVRELGDAAEGMYLITQQVPPSQEDNEGIAQMREEFEAAGLDPDGADLGPVAVQYWSDVHLVADALGQLSPQQIDSLDSAMVFGAVKAFTPIDRSEIAPADFSRTAYPDIESLAPFRLYSGFAMALHVEDGEYVPVSEFVDVTTPFEMKFES
jgi:ABC-type branched-subunit amino acid transport system substrate-binding protein